MLCISPQKHASEELALNLPPFKEHVMKAHNYTAD